MSTRFTLVLALGSLFSGGCCYCDSSFDYCGPLFGGASDPYMGDCGAFHRVQPRTTTAGKPVMDDGIHNQDYYDPGQSAPMTPMPGPEDGQMFRASTEPERLDDAFESYEAEGPLLFGQGPREQNDVAQGDFGR